MLNRPASWFGTVALVAAVVALLGVPFMEWLQHMHLSQWLHIPLTVVALTMMGGGATVAGAAYLEYQSRIAKTEQKA